MLCPECLKNGKQVKLKVLDSRPDGPFKRFRHYKCQACEYDTWAMEALPIAQMAFETHQKFA